MTHEQLAEKIAARLNATGLKFDGHTSRIWTGDHVSRIYWGNKTCVEIDARGAISNLRGGHYTSPVHLFEAVEKAKALVLERGW